MTKSRKTTASPPHEPLSEIPDILDWRVECADVDRGPRAGLDATFEATDAQRQAIADELDLTACDALAAHVTVRARAGGRYSVAGRIVGEIEQACVVTLEPIRSHIDEPLAVEFCPEADIDQMIPPATDFGPDDEDEPFPIVAGGVEIGRAVFEHLALAIDPFPRIENADAFVLEKGPAGTARAINSEGQDSGSVDTAPAKPSPFAALAKLKLHKDE